MPNTRRRRFSVQHDISGRDPSKFQKAQQSSHPEPESELKMSGQNFVANRQNKNKNKTFPNSSKNNAPLDIVAECDSSTSVMTVKHIAAERVDKDVTARSSNIDLFDMLEQRTNENSYLEHCKENILAHKDITLKNRDSRQLTQDASTRRDKHPRQHRVKVRSPKRRLLAQDARNHDDITKQTTGTNAIDWEQEIEVPLNNVTHVFETTEEEETRPSNHSLDDMCRICHGGDSLSPELGQLISACSCRGTVGRVHVKCLERWLTESGKSRCELCGTRYATKRVHRYGVPRALVMWILSQNAKQLMVDSLGIMLMSPLAVLAAWLSGRTLAGLMTQDSHITPWPLASTFVLACMTLVCYYCWIVSAATRHALGWWIWYRSQYEVRLQFQQNEE